MTPQEKTQFRKLNKRDQIEYLVSGILMERAMMDTSTAKALSMIVSDAMVDNHVIGLPDEYTRTSVSVDLIDNVGKLMHCRAGDDADDICKAVIAQVGG